MSRIGNTSQRILMGVALFAGAVITSGAAFAQAGQAAQAPAYNRDEYDRYIACTQEKVPEQKIRCLDEFVAKSPNAAAALAPYIDNNYMLAYRDVKDWPKTIEAADKLLAFGEKITAGDQLNARYIRAQAYIAGTTTTKQHAGETERGTRFRAAGTEGSRRLEKARHYFAGRFRQGEATIRCVL